MVRGFIAPLVLVALALPLAAQTPAERILERQEAFAAALRSGQGREAIFSKDYINVGPRGALTTGFQPSAPPNAAYYQKDVKVVVATASGAVVTMLSGPRPATAQVPSATDPDRWMNVWANEQGTWRLVARQGVWVHQRPQSPPAQRADVVHKPYTPANAGEAAVTPGAEFVKNIVVGGAGARLAAPASDETRVRIYGDMAVVTFRNLLNTQRVMRVFVNRGGAWKAVATISTNIWPEGTTAAAPAGGAGAAQAPPDLVAARQQAWASCAFCRSGPGTAGSGGLWLTRESPWARSPLLP